jgi:predicted DNA-binding transcriptional regulator AlpA
MPNEATAYEGVEFLSDGELAHLLAVSTRTILRWRRHGNGPPFCRIGLRCVRYRRADVVAWADANTFETLAAETVASQGRSL